MLVTLHQHLTGSMHNTNSDTRTKEQCNEELVLNYFQRCMHCMVSFCLKQVLTKDFIVYKKLTVASKQKSCFSWVSKLCQKHHKTGSDSCYTRYKQTSIHSVFI